MAKDRVERDEEDLVRLYLTDIGQYPLLTKEGEVRLAQQIEGGVAARSEMDKAGGGAIVNIASTGGLEPSPMLGAYSVSKAAIIMLTKVLAAELGSSSIRVNCIAPGAVDTPQMRGSTASAEVFNDRNQGHPMGRVGSADEIANLVLWLASDEASYVSGSTYTIDGGALASAT